MEVPLLLGAINRLPSSWEEGLGVEEKNMVTTYF